MELSGGYVLKPTAGERDPRHRPGHNDPPLNPPIVKALLGNFIHCYSDIFRYLQISSDVFRFIQIYPDFITICYSPIMVITRTIPPIVKVLPSISP